MVARRRKSIVVTVAVTNSGNTTAAGALQIAFFSSPTADGSNAFSLATASVRITIKSDHTQTLRLKIPVPAGSPVGSQFLVAAVDSDDNFSEIDLLNNTVVSVSPVMFG